jgi:PTH1 family peptidyl-tRNA hydrolase
VIAFLGLGNVSTHYARTKHNFGFWVVDEFARRQKLSFHPGKGDFVYAESDSGDGMLLVKPTSGMNSSGIPVKDIRARWEMDLKNLHLIVDDVDLPLGTMRIPTSEKMRPAEDYVLKPFRKQDQQLAEEMIHRGADAMESILAIGLEKTMSQFNRVEKEEMAE